MSDATLGRKIRWRLEEFKGWSAAAFAAVAGNAFATEAKTALDAIAFQRLPEHGRALVSLTAYLALFVLSVVLLYRQRGVLFHPRTRLRPNERPPQREHLILFVSNLKPSEVQPSGLPHGFEPEKDLTKDLARLLEHKQQTNGRRWPWEMVLRGMLHHVPLLRTVSFFCSQESIAQVHLLVDIIKHYKQFDGIKLKVIVKRARGFDVIDLPSSTPLAQGGLDFENFDDLSGALLWILKRFNRDDLISDEAIMIDFTSGNKVASVVAASVTFNRDLKAQYVPTDPKSNHEPIGYDCVLVSSQTPGLG